MSTTTTTLLHLHLCLWIRHLFYFAGEIILYLGPMLDKYSCSFQSSNVIEHMRGFFAKRLKVI